MGPSQLSSILKILLVFIVLSGHPISFFSRSHPILKGLAFIPFRFLSTHWILVHVHVPLLKLLAKCPLCQIQCRLISPCFIGLFCPMWHFDYFLLKPFYFLITFYFSLFSSRRNFWLLILTFPSGICFLHEIFKVWYNHLCSSALLTLHVFKEEYWILNSTLKL